MYIYIYVSYYALLDVRFKEVFTCMERVTRYLHL